MSRDVGLDRPIAAMGANFGDIDNDGYLDVYFGTGWMSYSGPGPQRDAQERRGTPLRGRHRRSGTGHLQKGHGVSFAD